MTHILNATVPAQETRLFRKGTYKRTFRVLATAGCDVVDCAHLPKSITTSVGVNVAVTVGDAIRTRYANNSGNGSLTLR